MKLAHDGEILRGSRKGKLSGEMGINGLRLDRSLGLTGEDICENVTDGTLKTGVFPTATPSRDGMTRTRFSLTSETSNKWTRSVKTRG